MLIILSGVSGSGKNTVIEELKKRKDFKVFRSAVTRKPRPNEKKSDIYLFMSKDKFEEKLNQGLLFEHELVHGEYRGILKDELEKVKKDKNHDYIRDIDVKGNQKLRKYFAKDEILSIFLEVDDEELKRRLHERGENEESIKLRLSRAPFEREHKKDYDIVIDNDNLNNTVDTILKAIERKRQLKSDL